MRLIDADALKEKLTELKQNKLTPSWSVALNLIDNAPTVEDHSRELVQKSLELGRNVGFFEGKTESKRPQGEWIITSEDTEGIHHIACPFCKYEKGSDFKPYIRVTFDKLPPFCEKCGADMRGKEE